MASRLAHDLGISAAHTVDCLLSDDFLEGLEDEELRRSLASGPRLVLASIDAGDGWRLFDTAGALPRSALERLVAIVTFDCLIENSDRSVKNPNLLRSGDKLMLIDHEEAFSTAVAGPTGPRPWKPEGMYSFAAGNMQHALIEKLAPKSRCDFNCASPAWKRLPRSTVESYAEDAPGAWDQTTLTKIASYILEAQAHIDLFCENANGMINR